MVKFWSDFGQTFHLIRKGAEREKKQHPVKGAAYFSVVGYKSRVLVCAPVSDAVIKGLFE